MRLDPSIVRDASAIAVLLGVPLLVFMPRIKCGAEAIFLRFLLSVGVTWASFVAWFFFIAVPVARTLGEVRTGRDVLIAKWYIIPYGCIPAAIGSIIAAGIYLLFRYVTRKRKHAA